MLHVINSSAQRGGHALPATTVHSAAVCTIVATRGLKDEKVKISIVSKVIKQYNAKSKAFSDEKFRVYSELTHGGEYQPIYNRQS